MIKYFNEIDKYAENIANDYDRSLYKTKESELDRRYQIRLARACNLVREMENSNKATDDELRRACIWYLVARDSRIYRRVDVKKAIKDLHVRELEDKYIVN